MYSGSVLFLFFSFSLTFSLSTAVCVPCPAKQFLHLKHFFLIDLNTYFSSITNKFLFAFAFVGCFRGFAQVNVCISNIFNLNCWIVAVAFGDGAYSNALRWKVSFFLLLRRGQKHYQNNNAICCSISPSIHFKQTIQQCCVFCLFPSSFFFCSHKHTPHFDEK